MKDYLEKHHRTFGSMGALIAFVIAVIYLVVVPEESSDAAWIQKNVLIYGHSLCWFVLCVASILWSIKKENRWSVPLAYVALTVYVVFVSALLFAKFM
ncbi:MAG TPA: hypothetical protein VGE13_04545 [Candidatus Saccharimonadales bacterium]